MCPECLTKFAAKNFNSLSKRFEESNLKPWDDLKLEYSLTDFQWLQLKHAIPHKWKKNIKQNPVMSAALLSKSIILLKKRES